MSANTTDGNPLRHSSLRVVQMLPLLGAFAVAISCKPGSPSTQTTQSTPPPASPQVDQTFTDPGAVEVRRIPSETATVTAEVTLTSLLPEVDTLPASPAALLSECERILEALTTAFPRQPDAFEVKARFFNWRGDSEEAENQWRKCVALDPNYGHAFYGLGKVAVKKGNVEESVELFRQALKGMPNIRQVEIELAKSLIDLDRTAEAIALIEKRRATNVLPAEAWCLLGAAYVQQKEYEKARQSFQACVDVYPEHAEGHYGLTTTLTRLGETEQATKSMQKFRELKSKFLETRTAERNEFNDLAAMCEDIAAIYSNVGRIYFVHGKTAEAETIWRRSAALDSANIECRQSLAWLYRQSGRIDKAIESLEKLAAMTSDISTYLLEIGRLRAEQGQLAEAEKIFRDLCQTAPHDPAPYQALAKLYQLSGREAESEQAKMRATQLESERNRQRKP